MKTARWFTVGALLSLAAAAPASARDGAAAREGRRQAPERSEAAATKSMSAPTAQRPSDEVRPCCVARGGKVYDHLRG